MQLSSKSVGVFEAFYNSAKVSVLLSAAVVLTAASQPISLINYSVEVAKSGKIPAGRTEGLLPPLHPVAD